MTKARGIRLEDYTYEEFGKTAKEEGRTQNGLMKYLLELHAKNKSKKSKEEVENEESSRI